MQASILKKELTPAWKKEPSPARNTQVGAAWYSQITDGITKGFESFESAVQKTVEQTMDARNPPPNTRQADGDEREAESTASNDLVKQANARKENIDAPSARATSDKYTETAEQPVPVQICSESPPRSPIRNRKPKSNQKHRSKSRHRKSIELRCEKQNRIPVGRGSSTNQRSPLRRQRSKTPSMCHAESGPSVNGQQMTRGRSKSKSRSNRSRSRRCSEKERTERNRSRSVARKSVAETGASQQPTQSQPMALSRSQSKKSVQSEKKSMQTEKKSPHNEKKLPKKDTALRQKQPKKLFAEEGIEMVPFVAAHGTRGLLIVKAGDCVISGSTPKMPLSSRPKHQIRNKKATAAFQNPKSKKVTKIPSKAAAATAKKSIRWNLWSTKSPDGTQANVEGQKPKSKKPAASTSRERPSTAKKSGKIKNGNDKSDRQREAPGEVMNAIEKFRMHAKKLGIGGKELLDAVSEARQETSELSPIADPPGSFSSSLYSL